MFTDNFKRSIVPLVLGALLLTTMNANAQQQEIRVIHLTSEEAAALRQSADVFQDYFRGKADGDAFNEASQTWDSQVEKIRNRIPQNDRSSAAIRQEQIKPLDTEFDFPPSKPIEFDDLNGKGLNSLVFPHGHSTQESSSSDIRIKLPEGLMNWPMPKPKPRSQPEENLQKFDFTQLYFPAIDKKLAMPK